MCSAARLPGADFTRVAEPSAPLLVFLGHGSRDPRAAAEHEALAAAYRARCPGVDVTTAYVELADPSLEEGLARAAHRGRRVVVVPLFLFAAGHVKNDVPIALEAARARFPAVDFAAAPALGVHPTLVDLAWERAAPYIPDGADARARTLVLVVGRGASDPDANGDFCKVARLFAEGRGLLHVEPTFLGITDPRVAASLERASRLQPDRIVVVPYLLFAGRLLTRLAAELDRFAQRHPWIRVHLAPHLGHGERLLSVVEERVSQAVDGRARLECDACQYRTALPGLAREVGGMRALLYSVRHAVTHGPAVQAGAPEHVHHPLKKHVLVCGSSDCADRGSLGVMEAFRAGVHAAGRARDIRVTRTACMGRCGEGPTVAVYPDGVWYAGVGANDAVEIVREHLLEDRLVARLVGDILH